jgi:drug/metabolite transporter (DMT)-like permease
MNHDLAAVIFGLIGALSWGSGDFSGGVAAKRMNTFVVLVVAHTTGLILLVALALLSGEPFPSPLNLLWGGAAGLVGAIGLAAFYQALAVGRMGVVAPIAAVLSAGLPVIFTAFAMGLPGVPQLIGFGFALVAVWLISRPERAGGRPRGVGLAVLAGLGFGSFFILLAQVRTSAIFWPLATARLASLLLMTLIVLIRRPAEAPKKTTIIIAILAGVLDVGGNVFFVLATHAGRLDVASVVSSLYPGATVLLASIFLKERLTRMQVIGLLFALVAIPLISV